MASELYTGPAVLDEEILSVYVVFNGPLKMSAGKLAAMGFHCGRRAERQVFTDVRMVPSWKDWANWYNQGKRVVTKIAETENVFARVCAELMGFGHHDEGLTEVEHGACVAFVTKPYRRDEVPQILRHKRCQLL